MWASAFAAGGGGLQPLLRLTAAGFAEEPDVKGEAIRHRRDDAESERAVAECCVLVQG